MALDQIREDADRTSDEPLLIDVKTTCRKLDISRPTVEKLITDGKLKSLKLGRRRLVNFASVVAFAEGRA